MSLDVLSSDVLSLDAVMARCDRTGFICRGIHSAALHVSAVGSNNYNIIVCLLLQLDLPANNKVALFHKQQ